MYMICKFSSMLIHPTWGATNWYKFKVYYWPKLSSFIIIKLFNQVTQLVKFIKSGTLWSYHETQKQKSYLDSIPICLFDEFASQSERNAKSSSEITLNISPGQEKESQNFEKTKNIRKRRKLGNLTQKFKSEEIKIPTSYRSLVGTIDTEPRSNGDTNNDRSKAFHVKPSIAFVTEKKLIVSFSGAAFLAGDVTVAVFVFFFFLFNHRDRFRHYLSHWFHLPRWWRFGGRASRWSFRPSPGWARRRRGRGSAPCGHDGS